MTLRRLVVLSALLLPFYLPGQPSPLPDFPAAFVGEWAGELTVYGSDGVRQTVPMELLIQPLADTAYTYTIIYGEDREAGKRDYRIVRGPDGPHHWICDENNSILLDGYYLGGVYQSVFTVQGNWLTSTLELQGDSLRYAIFSGKTDPVRISGGTQAKEEEIPTVESFLVTGYQCATLGRKK